MKTKKFFRSMISALIFTVLFVHFWSNMILDITYKSWSRASFGALGFLVCLSITIISLGVMWYTIEHSKIFRVIIEFLKRDGRTCIAIAAAIIFMAFLKISLTAWILKLTTPEAIGVYAIQIGSFVTAVIFWPRRDQIPETE